MKRIFIIGIITIILVGIVIAQGFTLPTTFTLNPNWALLPSPQPNQKIFGCPYELPLEIRHFRYTNYGVNGGNVWINASFSLYSGDKRSACGVKQQIFTCPISNWQGCLENYITTQSNNNITTKTNISSNIGIGN